MLWETLAKSSTWETLQKVNFADKGLRTLNNTHRTCILWGKGQWCHHCSDQWITLQQQMPGLSVQKQLKYFLLLNWMLVHDNVTPVTVTLKEKPQSVGRKQVKLRTHTVLLFILTGALCELSITEAATVSRGEGSSSCCTWNTSVSWSF